jgi:hypothetical protein
MKLRFSQQIFKKYSNIKFRQNLVEAKLFHVDRQMDSHDKDNSRLSQVM